MSWIEKDPLEKKLNETLSTLSTKISLCESRMTDCHTNYKDLPLSSLMSFLTSFMKEMQELIMTIPRMYTFIDEKEEGLREVIAVMKKALRWIENPMPLDTEYQGILGMRIARCLTMVKTCSEKLSQQQVFDHCDYEYSVHEGKTIYQMKWDAIKTYDFTYDV